MWRWIPVLLVLIYIAGTVIGESITGGQTIVITGGGSKGNGAVPTGPIGRPNSLPPVFDPRNLNIPEVNIPPTPPQPNPSNNNSIAFISGSTSSSPLVFEMTSEVKGTGSFSQLSKLIRGNLIAGQAAKADYGDLNQSSKTELASDQSSSDTSASQEAVVSLKGGVAFNGNSYSERNSFANGPDIVHDSFEAGSINKSSTYFSWYYNNLGTDNSDNPYSQLNRSTIYDIGARFVGSSRFNAKLNNSVLANDYIGYMALYRRLESQESFRLKSDNLSSVICCP